MTDKKNKAQKILIINRVCPPQVGATGRLLLELAVFLGGEGHDVTVMSTGQQSTVKRDGYGIEIVRVKAQRHPRSMWANFWISLQLFMRALFLARPDIIITKTDPPFFVIWGVILAKLRGAKHIHWSQDLYPDILPALRYKISPRLYRVLDRMTGWALRSCDAVVAIGTCMKQEMMRKGVPEDKITTIPNWADRMLLRDIARRNASGETDEKQDPAHVTQKFRVLYAGNLGRGHPVETILEAARILNKNEHDIEFLFVGSSPRMRYLADVRARERLENIRFLPYQPRKLLRGLLESGDLHLISMHERAHGKMLPSRIYDIFAVKRPCLFLGTENTDLFVMLETMQAGMTIPHGRADFLANTIRHLRDNGEAWHALYKGAEAAAEKYTPERSLDQWKELLEILA